MSEVVATVLDAGPLIHLDELGCLDLLEGLGRLEVSAEVWEEVQKHRPRLRPEAIRCLRLHRSEPRLRARLRQLSAKLLLQSGEVSALALALEHGVGLFLSDDTAARVAAETLGLKVHGTLGIVVRAIRRGTRTRNQVRKLLESIPEQTTLHISRSLLSRVLISLP